MASSRAVSSSSGMRCIMIGGARDPRRPAALGAHMTVPSLLGWDCLELWVGNARTSAGFLMSAFGFTCTAYGGPETGMSEKASYVLEQGEIRLVVSGALHPDSPIAEHVRRHGDGVHD